MPRTAVASPLYLMLRYAEMGLNRALLPFAVVRLT